MENMNNSEKLIMSFDPQTIEHLGIQMYSVLPNAIAELIANAYDAEASTVHINLIEDGEHKSISVSDNGIGMSFDEINQSFLRIGRKRREEDRGLSQNGRRKVTGRKGLGKLAFFGIGDTINIETKKNGTAVSFVLSWVGIKTCSSPNYEPEFHISACGEDEHGTTIVLSDLKRKSAFNITDLAISLSKLFDFYDDTFKVTMSYNDSEDVIIDERLKYQGIVSQIEWIFPDNQDIPMPYFARNGIHGKIIASEKPLKPGLRGITLFAHGRLVNAPEFFGVGESSHGFSYYTGWLDVDFIDELDVDVISTDRQSLNWDLDITSELRDQLKSLLRLIERDWREKRKKENEKKIINRTKVDISSWYTKLPNDIKTSVAQIVSSVVEDSELPDEKQSEIVSTLHALIPEYAKYHWRHLHTVVQHASSMDYQRADYYRAVEESIKRYQAKVQDLSGSKDDGVTLMHKVFGKEHPISVTAKFKKDDGTDFSEQTKQNIEDGQEFLSAGMMAGVRNPLAHEEIRQLRESGLFSEDDCLDMLSLLSHLFRRLDNAEKK